MPRLRSPISCVSITLVSVFAFHHCEHTVADDQAAKMLGEIIYSGRLAQGENELEAKLARNDADAAIRASLGIIQFLQAVEGVLQDYYRFGVGQQRGIVWPMRLPLSVSKNPQPISYSDARGIIERFESRLIKAESTLSLFKPSGIKLPIDVSKIYLDINNDGELRGNVSIWHATPYDSLIISGGDVGVGELIFAFDDADIFWLRGYINVLLGTVNVILAHDWRDAFERTAHLAFAKPETPYPFLMVEGEQTNWSPNQIFDLVAFVHVLNFEVIEPKRMHAALTHFEQVVALSRITWKWIGEEADNDREWLPGPSQTSYMLAGRLGGLLGANWLKVLDRAELVLQGKELIPFWRGYADGNAWVFFGNVFGDSRITKFHPELGINLRKVFTDPKRFDLVLWLQGTGVAPFLEKGKTIDLQAWQDLSQTFDGRLPFFSFWIN